MKKDRHYCTCCKKKVYAEKMIRVYYKLLEREAWHCNKCIDKHNAGLIVESAIVYIHGQKKETEKR
jgi:hypothetical protein